MDENNNQQAQVPKEPTKKEKAQQAGKDVAELAAKGAATYFGGPAGGAIVDKVAKTKAGQKVLDKAGKTLAKNPVTRNALAKAQPTIQKAKPALDMVAGSMGGAPGGAASAGGSAANGVASAGNVSGKSGASISPSASNNSSLASSSNQSNNSSNSGFGSNKSGLFSGNGEQKDKGLGDLLSGSMFGGKNKAKLLIIKIALGFFAFLLLIVVIVTVIFGPILLAKEAVESAANGVGDFFSSLGNWLTFKGWCANDQECASKAEEEFYTKMSELHEDYKKDGITLETELLTATVFYGSTDIYGNLEEATEDSSEEKAETFREGRSRLSTLAKQMVSNGKISLNKYYNYLINTYIEKYLSDLLEGYSDDARDHKIKTIADEIMSFSPNWTGKGYLSYTAGCQYIKVTKSDGSSETLDLEEYVAGVVTAEFGSASLEARKAQAVAARSYVLASTDSSCTIESSSNKQNYTTPSTLGIEAATETEGEILVGSDGNKFGTEYDSFYTNESKDSNGSGGFYCDDSFCFSNYYRKGSSDQSQWKVHTIKVPASWKNKLIGGHGRGMSQWGAEYLSTEEGYDYTKILEYFYEDGVQIRTISDGFYMDGVTFYEGENGFNGRIYYYDQTDYADYPYGSYGTIKSHGCGPSSLAIAISSLLNEDHNPVEITNWACDNGYCTSGGSYWSLIVDAPKKYGLSSQQVGTGKQDLQKVVDALSTGDSIVVAIMGPGNFTNGGHFITLTGINENQEVMVYDPNNGDENGRSKYWDFNLVVEQNNGAFWIISR